MIASRRQMERDRRRELLLAAAERVFGRKPFDEASMQEVAAEAQIGMQGLYEHFPSKQSLYESLIFYRIQGFQKRATEAIARINDPLGRLRAWALLKVEAFDTAPTFFPVFLAEKVHHDCGFESRFGPATYELYRQEEKRVRQLLSGAVRAGLIKRTDPEFLAQFFLGTLQASLHHHFRKKPGERAAACVDRAMSSFLSGAGVKP